MPDWAHTDKHTTQEGYKNASYNAERLLYIEVTTRDRENQNGGLQGR